MVDPDESISFRSDASSESQKYILEKNKEDVIYPIKGLDMSKYMKPKPEESHLYDLYGVLCHEGSIGKGHYYSFVKNKQGWLWFNDQVVTEVREDFEVLVSPQAYILFYQRRDLKEI